MSSPNPTTRPPRVLRYAGRDWHLTPAGYYRDSYKQALHRFMYERHVGPIQEGHVVHHMDGNPFNNDWRNLEAMTSEEHKRRHREEGWTLARHRQRTARRRYLDTLFAA